MFNYTSHLKNNILFVKMQLEKGADSCILVLPRSSIRAKLRHSFTPESALFLMRIVPVKAATDHLTMTQKHESGISLSAIGIPQHAALLFQLKLNILQLHRNKADLTKSPLTHLKSPQTFEGKHVVY